MPAFLGDVRFARGANSAVFTIVNAMLLKPRVGAPQRQLVSLFNRESPTTKPDSYRAFSYAAFDELRAQPGIFASRSAHTLAMVGVREGLRVAGRIDQNPVPKTAPYWPQPRAPPSRRPWPQTRGISGACGTCSASRRAMYSWGLPRALVPSHNTGNRQADAEDQDDRGDNRRAGMERTPSHATEREHDEVHHRPDD